MKKVMGWPVVTTSDCFDTVRAMGIKPWPESKSSVPLSKWVGELAMQPLEEQQQIAQEMERFCPKVEVQFLDGPGQPNQRFYRVKFRPWATTVAFIEHDGARYVPVTAEWKQGNRLITLVPPSGVPGKVEAGIEGLPAKMSATAKREFEEETGLELSEVIPLGPKNGLWDMVRNSELSFYPFLGVMKENSPQRKSRFDDNEYLKIVLFEYTQWLLLLTETEIPPDFGIESCAVSTTLLAICNRKACGGAE